MKKQLFLIGSGMDERTSLLHRALGEHLAEYGGYCYLPYLDSAGSNMGLQLFPAAALSVEGYSGEVVLDFSSMPPKRDNEVFRALGTQLLQEASYYPVALLEELGGFELVIPQFRQALMEYLALDLPCIGSIKSAEEAEGFRALFGLGQRYTDLAFALRQTLQEGENCCVLDLDKCDENEAEQTIRAWAAEYL